MSQEGIKIVKLDNVYNLNTDASNYNNNNSNNKPKKPRKSKYVNKHRGAMFWFNYIIDYVSKFKPKYRDYNRFLIYRKK